MIIITITINHKSKEALIRKKQESHLALRVRGGSSY